MRARASLLLVVIACLAPLIVPSTASSQTTDLSGTWAWEDCSNQTSCYSGPATIVHNLSGGTFTWSWDGDGPDSSSFVTGNATISGSNFTLNTDPYGSTTNSNTYTAQFQGQIVNANLLQGTWTQSDGQDGTFTANRTSSSSSTPTPSPSETGQADLCVKLVAQHFDGTTFREYDSCTNTAEGAHQILWYRRFPLLIKVTNRGPDPATTVRANVVLSTGLNFGTRVNEGICGEGYRKRTCNFGTIESGASKERNDLFLQGDGTLEATLAEVSVTVNSSTPDPFDTDNESSVQTELLPGGADLKLTASGPDRVTPSSTVTYRAVLINNGPDTAKDVLLSGSFSFGRGALRTIVGLDASRDGCNFGAGTFHCEFRKMVKGRAGEVIVKIRVVVPGVANGRDIVFQAEGHPRSTQTPDPNTKNNDDKQRTTIR